MSWIFFVVCYRQPHEGIRAVAVVIENLNSFKGFIYRSFTKDFSVYAKI